MRVSERVGRSERCRSFGNKLANVLYVNSETNWGNSGSVCSAETSLRGAAAESTGISKGKQQDLRWVADG